MASHAYVNETVQSDWWKRQDNLPHWMRATSLILLIPLSSATVERVLSLLEAHVSSCQARLLEDRFELAFMLQCNWRADRHE